VSGGTQSKPKRSAGLTARRAVRISDEKSAVPYDLRIDGYLSNNRRDVEGAVPYGIQRPLLYASSNFVASLGL